MGYSCAMQLPLLVGKHEFTLDAKNRVVIPACKRPRFAEGVYLLKERERCIGAYTPDGFERRLQEEMDATAPGSIERRDIKRFLASGAVFHQELDRQGRVTISAQHLDYAGISRDVVVVGAVDHLEIWDRSAWAEYESRLEGNTDAPAKELVFS